MKRYSRKVFLLAAGFILLSHIVCLASGFEIVTANIGLSGLSKTAFSRKSFSLNPVSYTKKSFEFKTPDIMPTFMILYNETLTARRRVNHNRILLLDYQRDEYLFSIGSESRPLEEQVEYVKRLLKLKKEAAE